MGIKKISESVKNHFAYKKYEKEGKLIEFDLLNFNKDLEMAWRKVKALYDKVLYKDKQWHLFYEDAFSTLRCSPKYARAVEKFFKKFNIEYRKNGVWLDGSAVVRKHQDIYKEMFHSFSELAIHLEETDLYTAADRVCHCFLNHVFYMAKDHRKSFDGSSADPSMWEAEMMSRLSVYRANYIGKLETVKHYTKLAKEKQEEE